MFVRTMNPCRIDVHMHTCMSDGRLPVIDLLHRCKEQGLRYMAITDHDTFNGVLQLESFEYEGMTIIPGIEMSSFSSSEKQIHVTGYFSSSSDLRSFQDYLDQFVFKTRVERCKRILSKMAAAGYSVPYSMIEEKAKQSAPSLPIIADCLVELGYSKGFRDSFDQFLGDTAPFYEPLQLYDLKQAIDLIHSHQGVAAVAHPWLCLDPLRVCEDAVQLGVDGLECFPPEGRSEFGTSLYSSFAKEHGLFCSSGSDYHGIEGAGVMVGTNVFPEEYANEFIEVMKKHNII